jgi:glutamine synthetase
LRQPLVLAKLFLENFGDYLGRFDGSSVKGFMRVEESNLLLRPGLKTYALIPWYKGVARFVCDIYTPGSRLVKDPRYVSQKNDEYLSE